MPVHGARPSSSIGDGAMLSAEPAQARDGSPLLATIATDAEQLLAHDAVIDTDDFGHLLTRLAVDELEKQSSNPSPCSGDVVDSFRTGPISRRSRAWMRRCRRRSPIDLISALLNPGSASESD